MEKELKLEPPREAIGIEPLERIIKLCIFSTWLKNERPVSLLIMAKPEHYKTQAIIKYCRETKGCKIVTDMTRFGILEKYQEDIQKRKIKLLAMPDLLTTTARKDATVRMLISFFNQLTEEGVYEIHTKARAKIYDPPLKCAIITATTKKFIFDKRRLVYTMGFVSRMLPFSFSYASQTRSEIMKSISKEHYHLFRTEKLRVPRSPQTVEGNVKLFEKLRVHVDLVCARIGEHFKIKIKKDKYIPDEEMKPEGYRIKRALQTLMKASALMDGRNKVTQRDFDNVIGLAEWINYQQNPIYEETI